MSQTGSWSGWHWRGLSPQADRRAVSAFPAPGASARRSRGISFSSLFPGNARGAGRHRGERGGLIGRLIGFLFLVAILLALFFARFFLMALAGEWLVVSDPLQPANAIIQLSGDDYHADRAARAAQLYKAGWAPVVVASGSQLRPYLSEADLEARDLEADGVPGAAVIPYRQFDLYTLQEARDLLVLCRRQNWRRVIVVTSNYHTRRSRYIFRHVFPASIDVRVTPASDTGFQPDGWWKTRLGIKIMARESGALCVAFLQLHNPFHAKSP